MSKESVEKLALKKDKSGTLGLRADASSLLTEEFSTIGEPRSSCGSNASMQE